MDLQQMRGKTYLLSALVCMVVVLSCVSLNTTEPKTFPEIVKCVTPTVVKVSIPGAYGSGVFIDFLGERYVLTCYHVIEGPPTHETTITTSNGKKYRGYYVYGDRDVDLALFSVPESDQEALQLSTKELVIGESILVFGHPNRMGFAVSSGIVSGLNKEAVILDELFGGTQSFTDLILTDAPINAGNSGGPVVNQYGELVGIAQLTSSHDGIGLFIPISRIMEFLNAKDYQELVRTFFQQWN